jgi:gluconolactonase
MGNEKQDGVKIFDATGKPIGFVGLPERCQNGSRTVPERCANVCFGGVKRNRLFMAASHSLYSL